MKAALRFAGQVIGQAVVFLFFVLFLSFLAGMAQQMVSAALAFHWMAGVLLGMGWLITVVVLCSLIWYAMRPTAPDRLRRYFLIQPKTGDGAGLAEQYPAAALSALICVALLIAVFVLSLVSAALAAQGYLVYEIKSGKELPMRELLFRFYLWHTVDLVPVLGIWKIYDDIKPPLEAVSFGAKTLVLVFRVAFVGLAITIISQWLAFLRRSRQPSAG